MFTPDLPVQGSRCGRAGSYSPGLHSSHTVSPHKRNCPPAGTQARGWGQTKLIFQVKISKHIRFYNYSRVIFY